MVSGFASGLVSAFDSGWDVGPGGREVAQPLRMRENVMAASPVRPDKPLKEGGRRFISIIHWALDAWILPSHDERGWEGSTGKI